MERSKAKAVLLNVIPLFRLADWHSAFPPGHPLPSLWPQRRGSGSGTLLVVAHAVVMNRGCYHTKVPAAKTLPAANVLPLAMVVAPTTVVAVASVMALATAMPFTTLPAAMTLPAASVL